MHLNATPARATKVLHSRDHTAVLLSCLWESALPAWHCLSRTATECQIKGYIRLRVTYYTWAGTAERSAHCQRFALMLPARVRLVHSFLQPVAAYQSRGTQKEASLSPVQYLNLTLELYPQYRGNSRAPLLSNICLFHIIPLFLRCKTRRELSRIHPDYFSPASCSARKSKSKQNSHMGMRLGAYVPKLQVTSLIRSDPVTL